MKRGSLDKRFRWTAEAEKLRALDWEGNAEDFDQLYLFVLTRLERKFPRMAQEVQSELSEAEIRREIRRAAASFQDKYVSLPHYVYLRLLPWFVAELAKH